MKRRAALKSLALLSGGIALLPSCSPNPEKVSHALHNLEITGEQESLLAEIVESIIPSTESPGAGKLEVDKFVLTMVDDCMEQEQQNIFTNGLKRFDLLCKRINNTKFTKMTAGEREGYLRQIQNAAEDPTDPNDDLKHVKPFVEQIRTLTIEGYLTSQYVMTEVFPYELVPGRFIGCKKL